MTKQEKEKVRNFIISHVREEIPCAEWDKISYKVGRALSRFLEAFDKAF